jgi:hypothetical protein
MQPRVRADGCDAWQLELPVLAWRTGRNRDAPRDDSFATPGLRFAEVATIMRAVSKYLLLGVFAFGCVAEDGKGEEEELLDDSKADSQRSPTDHGFIGFAAPELAELTQAERFHAWEFDLTGDASLEMTTSYAVRGQRRVDTVLYLYKEKPDSSTGWGSYIARNDDYGNAHYSQIVRELGAGRYRVLVKGFAATTKGKFKITVNCTGAGCAPAPAACVFGDTYNDIATAPGLVIVQNSKITPATLPTLPDDLKAKLVRAVQQSSHTDVTTPEEALSRVDQEEINLRFIVEEAARRTFVSFEYGAGDNSYGAIFERDGDTMVTNIHDGDLENCTTQAQVCLLPEDWSALRNDPAFTRTGTRVVTQPSQLTGVEVDQALGAFRRVYGETTTLAQGLANADDDQLNVVELTHAATGAQISVFEFGAGDTSVGTIYYKGTTQIAGRINDLFIESCTLFAQ